MAPVICISELLRIRMYFARSTHALRWIILLFLVVQSSVYDVYENREEFDWEYCKLFYFVQRVLKTFNSYRSWCAGEGFKNETFNESHFLWLSSFLHNCDAVLATDWVQKHRRMVFYYWFKLCRCHESKSSKIIFYGVFILLLSRGSYWFLRIDAHVDYYVGNT